MVVAPASIDFEDVFLNFEQYLKESPYVLAVILVLFVVSGVIIVFLRRLDKADSVLVRSAWRSGAADSDSNSNNDDYDDDDGDDNDADDDNDLD